MSIRRLPFEIVIYVVGNLGLSDVYNLSLTCRHFLFLVTDERLCKALLEVSYCTGGLQHY